MQPDSDVVEHPAVRLDRFRALMAEAGVEEIVEETLSVYLAESPRRMERLAVAIQAGGARDVEAEAHALRSASLNIWAVELAETLKDVELAGVSGDIKIAEDRLPGVQREFDRVIAYLEAALPKDA